MKKRNDKRYLTTMQKDNKKTFIYAYTLKELNLKKNEWRKNNGCLRTYNKCSTGLNVGEWLEIWLDIYKTNTCKPSTLKQKQQHINKIMSSKLSTININQLKAEDVEIFLSNIESIRMRKHFNTLLKDALHKAYIRDIIKFDISSKIYCAIKYAPKETVPLSDIDALLFLKKLEEYPDWRLFYKLMLYQGLRCGEALALTPADINLDNRTININKTLNSSSAKTATSNRIIPIFNELLEDLINCKLILNSNDTICKFKNYKDNFKLICKKLDFHTYIPYSFRHTFATNCVEKGIDIKVLQKWLGHSTPSITMKHYIHVRDSHEQNQIDLMNKASVNAKN